MIPSPLQRVPAAGAQLGGDDPQQRRLAAAVGADDADALAAGDDEVDVEQDRIVAVAGVDALERQHALAAARAGAQRERHPAALEDRPLDLLHAVDLHLLHARLPGRALVDADVRPVAEAPHGVLEPGDLLLLGHVDLLLALELELAGEDVRAVGAGPDPDRPAVELGDLADGRVEQVAVVGDHHDGAVEVVEQRRQALAARHVEVGLGLVEQQHVGAPDQAGGERDELALAAGELARGRAGVDPQRAQVAERLALGAVAAGLGPGGERALVAGERLRHRVQVRRQRRVGQAAFGRVQLGLERRQLGPGGAHGGERVAVVAVDDLRQVGEHEPAPARHEARVGRVEAGEDPHQGRLAAAVGAEHADPRSRLHVEVGAAQDRAPAEGLCEAARRQYRHVG